MRIGTFEHKRIGEWYIEWSLLSHHEKALVHVDFNFPTPKDKSFMFGVCLFTLTLFFIEIAWIGEER